VLVAAGAAACGAGAVDVVPAPFAHPVAALPVVDVALFDAPPDPLDPDTGVAVTPDVPAACCRLLGDE
jgi:hypothetical protein